MYNHHTRKILFRVPRFLFRILKATTLNKLTTLRSLEMIYNKHNFSLSPALLTWDCHVGSFESQNLKYCVEEMSSDVAHLIIINKVRDLTKE
jgi:hypothetical protein